MIRRPLVTLVLIVTNVLAFGYEVSRVGGELVAGGGTRSALVAAGALVPVLVRAGGEYWRIVSGAFLHGSLMHLGANMYALYALGRFVEFAAGPRRMTMIYAISLAGSGLAIVWFAEPYSVTVGASGAIFGLMGALFAIGLKHGRAGLQFVRANLNILLLNLFITFALPGISRWGHIGGLVVGFATALVIYTPVVRPATGAQSI